MAITDPVENRPDDESAAIVDIFIPLIDRYVWFVRRSADDVLRAEFGQPHLDVHQPRTLKPGLSQAVVDALARRIVVPEGEWSLFVGDGAWVIETKFYTLKRNDTDRKKQEALRQLEGQKLTAVSYDLDATTLRLEFDLGGVLSITRCTPSGVSSWEDESQWTVFYEDGHNISLDNAMRLKREP